MPPREPITGEYELILKAALKFNDWDGVTLEACFSGLELPNFARHGRRGMVGRDEDDPDVFLFFSQNESTECLTLRKGGKVGVAEDKTDGDAYPDLVAVTGTLSLDRRNYFNSISVYDWVKLAFECGLLYGQSQAWS